MYLGAVKVKVKIFKCGKNNERLVFIVEVNPLTRLNVLLALASFEYGYLLMYGKG